MSAPNEARRGFPLEQLVVRLRELAHAVTQGPDTLRREMTMRVPAEPERDADLVLSSAASEIEQLHKLMVVTDEAAPAPEQPPSARPPFPSPPQSPTAPQIPLRPNRPFL